MYEGVCELYKVGSHCQRIIGSPSLVLVLMRYVAHVARRWQRMWGYNKWCISKTILSIWSKLSNRPAHRHENAQLGMFSCYN